MNLPFDVVESKLHIPVLRPGVVSRTALVNRLRVTTASSVVAVTAPAGLLWEDDALGAVGRSRQARLRMGLDRRARQRPSRPSQAPRLGYPPGRGARRAGPQRAPVLPEVDVGGCDSASGIGARLARASARPRTRRCPLASFARLAGRGFRARRSHATGLTDRRAYRVQPRLRIAALRTSGLLPVPRCRRARALGPGGKASALERRGRSRRRRRRWFVTRTEGGPPGCTSPRCRSAKKTARRARDRRSFRSPETTVTWPTTSAPNTSPGSHPSI